VCPTNGKVLGWTPLWADLSDHTVQARADNAAGADTVSWVVRVTSCLDFDGDLDVDQSDFGFFQACLSGGVIGFPSGCDPADVNGDDIIDGIDFNLFSPCVGGASRPPGC
jgi:hypothetical protein